MPAKPSNLKRMRLSPTPTKETKNQPTPSSTTSTQSLKIITIEANNVETHHQTNTTDTKTLINLNTCPDTKV